MAITFPDPDLQTEYEYTNDEGLVFSYSWDGEKWKSSGITGTGDVNTRQVALVNAIDAFADVLPPLDTLATQEDYNKYIYDAMQYLFENGSPADIDGGVYNPIPPAP